jgi:hypothetical protein
MASNIGLLFENAYPIKKPLTGGFPGRGRRGKTICLIPFVVVADLRFFLYDLMKEVPGGRNHTDKE